MFSSKVSAKIAAMDAFKTANSLYFHLPLTYICAFHLTCTCVMLPRSRNVFSQFLIDTYSLPSNSLC